MTRFATFFFLCLLFLIPIANSASNTSISSGTGVVTAISEGTLYIGGISHSIATVESESEKMRIAVPTMGVMQSLQIGESLSFSGPSININSGRVINTQEGFIYRANEKSMADYMAEQMRQAQAQAEAQMAEAAKTGIPNAVPTLVIESAEQVRESASKRQVDMLFMVLSIIVAVLTLIVAVLAFERFPNLIMVPARWVKSWLVKRTDTPGELAAQRIRIDCESEANHNLIRLLDKPTNRSLYKKISILFVY